MDRCWLLVVGVTIATGEGACGGAPPQPVAAPPQQTAGVPDAAPAASAMGSAAPATADSSAAAVPPSSPASPAETAASDAAQSRLASFNPHGMPQEDPVDPPRPSCPDVAALVKASAVMKHEPASRRRPHPPPSVLDIELTVTIPPNPGQVTFAANRVSVFGGVLVEETFQASTPGKDVLLIRPMGGVALETSLMVLFGLVCNDNAASGSLRIPMKAAIPWRDGDPVTVAGIVGY